VWVLKAGQGRAEKGGNRPLETKPGMKRYILTHEGVAAWGETREIVLWPSCSGERWDRGRNRKGVKGVESGDCQEEGIELQLLIYVFKRPIKLGSGQNRIVSHLLQSVFSLYLVSDRVGVCLSIWRVMSGFSG
jgi:hypothetical protein